MYICICKAVSEKEVLEAVEQGHSSLQQVQQRCGAGTDCGSCCSKVTEIISRTSRQEPSGQTSSEE